VDSEPSLQELRKQLELRPEQLDTTQLLPLFVPASFFSTGNWPGPHVALKARDIGLTWAILGPEQTMLYVSMSAAQYWTTQGIEWRLLALQNLRAASKNDVYTGVLGAESSPSAIFMTHPDGLGPSRLLLTDELTRIFPRGYRVAIPEMSLGIAFSLQIDNTDLEKVQVIIGKCYQDGTRPLARGVHAPEDLVPG
jgi:hypothetical protein